MVYQFEHGPITDCINLTKKKKCPLYEALFDSGFCNLSRKWVHNDFEEMPTGKPDWCELVRVK